MKYELKITKKAKEDFAKLEVVEQKRIANKLRFFILGNNPLKYAKKLNNFRLGAYRFRIGDYRVIFDVDKNDNLSILLILRVRHRKKAY